MSRRLGAVMLVCALTGCGGADDDAFHPLQPGDPAPEYGAATLVGDSLSLDSLRGRTVLLNVWATWCPPCRAEMPALQTLHDRYGAHGLEVVAVSIDNSAAAAAAFVEELDLGIRVLHDPDGRIARVFRTTGVPETFLIDGGGRIVRRWIGAFDPLAADVIDSVEALLLPVATGNSAGGIRRKHATGNAVAGDGA